MSLVMGTSKLELQASKYKINQLFKSMSTPKEKEKCVLNH
jgi:hypothetical protein